MYTCKRLILFFLFMVFISTIVGCGSGDNRIWGFDDDLGPYSVTGGNTGLGSIIGKVTASTTIKLSMLSPEMRAQVASSAVPIFNAIVWIQGYPSITATTDKGGLSAMSSIRVPVASPLSPPPSIPANRAPVPVISAITTVSSGANLKLSVSANDPDGTFGLSYQWSANPVKGTFSNSAAQNPVWTAPAEVGTYIISCIVSDGKLEGTTTQQVTVTSEAPVTTPGTITGYVRDVDTQQPIANALVVISGTDLFTVSDASGQFLFTGIKGGTYTLIASRNGYQIKTFTGIVVPAN